MSIGSSKPRGGGKRDLIIRIQLAMLDSGMTYADAIEATKTFKQKSVDELKLVLRSFKVLVEVDRAENHAGNSAVKAEKR